jgi:uncharacterized membrane protein
MLLLRLGLAIKGIDALFEVIVGALLFTPMKLGDMVDRFCNAEMFDHFNASQRAADALQLHAANAIHHSTTGMALYLVVHGTVKLIFILGAFWQKTWGYVGLITILSIFVAFELYHAAVRNSQFMLFLAFFDAILAYLAWREYRKHGQKAREPAPLAVPRTDGGTL